MIRVLVVEDEAPIQRDICRKIEQYSDEFKVVARASTGEEAVHLLEQIKIDVAFIDVNIPILNGLEVIRHINQLNPEIIKRTDPYETKESCLSLLGGPRKIKRYKKIRVQYQTLDFKIRTKTFEGWTAQIVQHEIDHCNGVLI